MYIQIGDSIFLLKSMYLAKYENKYRIIFNDTVGLFLEYDNIFLARGEMNKIRRTIEANRKTYIANGV